MKTEVQANSITLKIIERSNAATLHSLRTNAQTAKFIARKLDQSINDIEQFIDKVNSNAQLLFYKIETAPDHTFAGTICLKNIDKDKKYAEVGYELLPEFQQKGIMTAALQKIIHFAFTDLNLEVVEAFTHRENINSRKLLEKLQFNLLENRSDSAFPNNVIYQLIKSTNHG